MGRTRKRAKRPKVREEETVEEISIISASKRKKCNNFQIQLSKIDQNNWEYEGEVISNRKLIEPGNYDLIIKSDGTVIIKIKVEEDK
ncbi:MAG: hypothetical protein AB8F94_19880 [Saprospiraceae bacterium]